MPLLDTLEVWFTRRRPEPRPLSPSAERLVSFGRWLVPPSPDRGLKPTDFYSLSLYLRCALGMIARMSLVYSILWMIGLIWIGLWLWHSFPILFHPGKMQARVWHSFWKAVGPALVAKQFYIIPLVPLAWAFCGLIFWFPRALFWNRRARRLLTAEDAVRAEEVVAIAAPDSSVWPPSPKER